MVISSFVRPLASAAALIGLAAYATIMLRGPQGLNALSEKHQEIRSLELENANLRRDIQAKQARIDSLEHDPNTQEIEVRKRTKKQRPDEMKFIIPDTAPKTDQPNP